MFDDLINGWLKHHPSICAWLAIFIAHQYLQTWNMRRVMGMRRGDGIWMMPPRLSEEEKAAGGRPWWKWVLFTIRHPKKPAPIRRRPKTIPPPERQPEPSDFHDQKTQR